MRIYIAGLESFKELINPTQPAYILCSFYYCRKKAISLSEYPSIKEIMLDSGAFTFMKGAGKSAGIDWNAYIEEYAAYVKANNIKLYFELDIDHLVGLPEVERMRDQLERLVGYPPIPVWHKSRGQEKYLELLERYPYVALGGIAGRKWHPSEYAYFSWFIKRAHEKKVKIHGLGFTKLKYLTNLKFDSVDSTTWNNGSRFGNIQFFRGCKMVNVPTSKMKQKTDHVKVNIHNLTEWVKFQTYADQRL